MSRSNLFQWINTQLARKKARLSRARHEGAFRCPAPRALRLELLENRLVLSPAPFVSMADHQQFLAGGNPFSIPLGDVNGDGKMDMVVANWSSASISILLNTTAPGNTTPTFAPKEDFSTGNSPCSVSLGDLNGDGKLDIVVADYWPNTVSVLLNQTPPGAETANFADKLDFDTATGARSVSLADINGDGRPDLVVAGQQLSVVSVLVNTTLPGAATPTFAARRDFATGSRCFSVSAVDVNGDGKPDLVAANPGSSGVSVLLNTTVPGATTPSFAAKQDFGSGIEPRSVCVGDLNCDGKPDLAVANWSSDTVSVLLNTTAPGAGLPSFVAKQDFLAGTDPFCVSSGDLNGDGKPDLVVANDHSTVVSVLLNTTAPGDSTMSFAGRQDFETGSMPRSVSVGDLNGDGKPDLAVATYDSNSVSVLLNTTPWASDFGLAAKQDFGTGTLPDSVSFGDLNGDGKSDLVVANIVSNNASVFLNTTAPGAATPSFTTKQDFATGNGPQFASLADLNGDGKLDMTTANFYSNTASVLLNTTAPGASTASFAANRDFGLGSNPQFVALGDVNGDGKPDMAAANFNSNTVSVLLNTTAPGAATPSFASKQDFPTGIKPQFVALGDVNGDGKPDMAVANYSSSTVSVLLNTTAAGASTPSFAPRQDFATGTVATAVALGDINGDGRLDIAVPNGSSASVSVLLNITTPGAATPSFAGKQDFAVSNSPCSLSLGDLDGDGKLDVAAANYWSNTASVLLNTTPPGASTPSFADKRDFITGNGARSVSLTDLNGDGRLDLAVANRLSNSASVLLNTSVQLAVPTVSVAHTGGIYNGSPFAATGATVTGLPPDGVIASFGDPSLSYTYFADGTPLAGAPKDVGTYTVVAHYTSDNPDYASTDSAPVEFTITPASLTVSGITANDKVYDATTVATLNLGGAGLGGLFGGDEVTLSTVSASGTFETKDVGTDKLVSVAGLTIVGAQAFNYSLAQPTTTASITPATLTVAGITASEKIYDGTTTATLDFDDAVLVGVLGDDVVTLNTVSASGSFADKHLGVGKAVSVSGLALDGEDADNYALSPFTTTASIIATPFVSLAAKQDFDTSEDPFGSAIGDLNGDGKLDLVVTNFHAASVSVFVNAMAPGAATPGFSAKQDFTTGATPRAVAIADFNGDGMSDLAVANSVVSSISVLLNTTTPGAGTLSFSAKQDFAGGGDSMSVKDLNGDGRPDLVVVNSGANGVFVLLNTTAPGANAPSFSAAQSFATGATPDAVSVGDLNGDGKPDLAVGNFHSATVSVFLNTTAPGATTPSFADKQDFATGSNPVSVSMADFNGDGKLDLAVANRTSATVSVLLNTVTTGDTIFSFTAKQDFTTGVQPQSVSAGDLNGDGRFDLVVTNFASAVVSVLLNTTAPGAAAPCFASRLDFGTGANPGSACVGDLNGDGKPDVAVANYGSSSVSVLLNTTPWVSSFGLAAKQDFGTGGIPYSASAGDLNGDGKPELVVGNSGSDTVSVLLNTTAPGAATASFATNQEFATGHAPISAAVADINGDGKPDLIVANGGNTVSVLLSTTAPGATTFSFADKQDFTSGDGPNAVSLGDLNGDGKLDLVVANWISNSLSVLLNTTAPGASTPSFEAKQDFTAGTNPHSVALGDINGDGKLDVVLANWGSNTVSVFLNTTATGNSTSTFVPKQDFATGSGAHCVSLGDLNGDGRPDLVVTNDGSSTVSVLLNTTAPGTGTSSFAVRQDFGTGYAPFPVVLNDLNGDGRLDVAVANKNSNSVSVLLNMAAPGATTASFAAKQDFATGSNPWFMCVCDLNGDGKTDLAVADAVSDTVSVHLNRTFAIAVPTVGVTVNGGTYNGSPFGPTGATVTGLPPDGVIANFGDPSLSYTYFADGTPLAGAPKHVGTYTVVAHYTSDNPDYASTDSSPVEFTITPAPLTVSGIASEDKVYDASVAAALNLGTAALVGLFGGDEVTLSTVSASGTFETKDVGTDKLVSVAGLTIVGAQAFNYSLAQPTTTASITPATLTVAGITASEKIYDGTTTATLDFDDAVLVGVLGDDVVTLNTVSASGSFADKHLGVAKAVSVGGLTLDGEDAGNYALAPVTTTASIIAPPFVSLAPKQDFDTGEDPFGSAISDLNGDGKLDLVVTNFHAATVSVFLNTTLPGATAPSFSAKQDFGTGSLPRGLSVSDLNGDGRPDLAVANLNGTISVLLNSTAPGADAASFLAKQDFAGGTGSLCSDDLNGDGVADLVVVNSSSGVVSVILNTTVPGAAAASFTGRHSFATGTSPTSVSLGDLNGDGQRDMVVANFNSATVSVFLNTTAPGATTPSFSEKQDFATGANPSAVSLGDLNGDGKLDVAVPSRTSARVSILLNTTTAGDSTFTFSPRQDFTTGVQPQSVALGDLNGDGRIDLIVPNFNSATASVLLSTTAPGAATPSFAVKQDFGTGANPSSVCVGDLNGDGKPDLAIANYGSNTLSVLLNTTPWVGDFGLAEKRDFATGSAPRFVSEADFNGDGRPDLAVTNFASNTVSVLLNTTPPGATAPTFAARQDFSTGLAPWSASLADINGDGRPDLAVANENSDTVSVFLNTTAPGATTPSFAAKQDFSAGSVPCFVSLGDLNGDGCPDLVVANWSSNTVSVLLNTTVPGSTVFSFASKQDFITATKPGSVSLGDLNGDGKLDLAVSNFDSNSLSVLLNTTAPGATTPSFAAKQDLTTASKPCSVSLGDVNGDGKLDLVVSNKNSDTVSVLLNTTTSGATTLSFAAKQDFVTGSGPVSVSLGDLNGDGRPDLAVMNYNSATVSVLLNTTPPGSITPTFAARQDFSTGRAPWWASLADFDGDGKRDLAIANALSDTVSVLLNTTAFLALPTVSVTVNGGTYTSAPFAATDATVTGMPPDGAVASFGDPSLSYTYFADGTPLAGAPKDVGIYTVVAHYTSDNPDYASADSAPVEFTITPASLTVSGITASDKVYDAALTASLNLGPTALVGLFGADEVTLSTVAASGTFETKDVGTYKPVSVAGLTIGGAQAANYVLTQPTTVASITPAPLAVSGITADDKVYDASVAATLNLGGAALVGLFGGDEVTLSTAAASGTFETKDVGTDKLVSVAGLTIGGAQAFNYSLTQLTTAASVTPAPLTVSGITAEDKVYDATVAAALNLGAAALVGLFGGDEVTLSTVAASGTFDTKDVGTDKLVSVAGLTIGGAQAFNYSLTQPTSAASITPAPLTITADDQTKVYGAVLPTLTVSYNGFAGSETPAELTTLPLVSTSATRESHVCGTPYEITANSAAAANYDIRYVSGALTVTPAHLTITADDKTIIYGDPLPELTATCEGFVNGDTEASLSTPVALSTSVTPGSPVGSYPITASGATCADYAITYVEGTLSIVSASTSTTVGLYDPDTCIFYLRNSNSTGPADYTFGYGDPSQSWASLVGDWDGARGDTVGFFDPVASVWYLRNSLTTGFADWTFGFGAPELTHGHGDANWVPLVGDWDGDGVDTIGLFDPATCTWYLRNSLTVGYADWTIGYGAPSLTVGHGDGNWRPLVGDWDGDGTDTIGMFDPVNCVWYLKNSLNTGFADYAFGCGDPSAVTGHGADNWAAIVGDWDGTAGDSIGFFDPAASVFMLRNSLTTGMADLTFGYGVPSAGWLPLVGSWQPPTGKAVDQIDLAALVARELSSKAADDLDMSFAEDGPAAREFDALLTGLLENRPKAGR